MRYFVLFFVFLLIERSTLFAQASYGNLLNQGILLHDKGDYKAAIKVYEKALLLKPESMQIYYELALSSMAMNKYPEAIAYCEKAFFATDSLQNMGLIYALLGSAYDNSGKPEKAIEYYEKGLAGDNGDYLLYYNKGVTFTKMKENKHAIKSYIRALTLNIRHLSSNLNLGDLLVQDGATGLAFYNYAFFLLFEPDTDRSIEVLKRIQLLVKKDTNSPLQPTVQTTTEELNRIVSSSVEINNYAQLQTTLTYLHENRGNLILSALPAIYKSFYIPFFSALLEAGQLETFCYKATQSENKLSADWLKKHPDKLKALHDWVVDYWNSNEVDN